MNEKFNEIRNNISEKLDFSSPNRRVILGSVAAFAVFAAFPSETNAISNNNGFQDPSGTLEQSLSLDTRTGKAKCSVTTESYNTSFNSLSLYYLSKITVIKKWRTEPKF
jgi:hypothetical protein